MNLDILDKGRRLQISAHRDLTTLGALLGATDCLVYGDTVLLMKRTAYILAIQNDILYTFNNAVLTYGQIQLIESFISEYPANGFYEQEDEENGN